MRLTVLRLAILKQSQVLMQHLQLRLTVLKAILNRFFQLID